MDSIWWSKVPNAIGLINTITQHLLSEGSILLLYKEPLPWKDTLVNEIKIAIREENASKSFSCVSGVTSPGEYLLEEYCKAEKRAQYRPTKGHAKFFAESDDIILHEYYFWITVGSDSELLEWGKFISEYISQRSKNKSRAAFVLDYQGLATKTKYKGLMTIDCDKAINEYDKKVFATLVAAEINESSFVKTYLTELAVNTAGADVELIANAISSYESLLCDPYNTLFITAAETVRSDGRRFFMDKDSELVGYDVWKTQIRTIYPYIEEFRRSFIERHYNDIVMILPIEIKDGVVINDPNELELGALVYLAGIKKLNFQPNEYMSLEMFKDARNSLSHLETISWHTIEKLVKTK